MIKAKKKRKPRRKVGAPTKASGKAWAYRAAAVRRRAKLLPKSSRRHLKTKVSQGVVLTPKLSKKLQEQYRKADMLLARGRERGFVTYDEILKAFPNIET